MHLTQLCERAGLDLFDTDKGPPFLFPFPPSFHSRNVTPGGWASSLLTLCGQKRKGHNLGLGMPEEAQQEGGGRGAACWPQWVTSSHVHSPASEAPTWLTTGIACRAFTSPGDGHAHSSAGCVLPPKRARGSPRCTVRGTAAAQGCIPQREGRFFLT